jgi:F0F1-type ATP synthase assembly protein I
MKFASSISRVPELSRLTRLQRSLLVVDFSSFLKETERGRLGARLLEASLVGGMIFAEIAGFFCGYFIWGTLFWGPICGMLIGFSIIGILCFLASGFLNAYYRIPRFQRYVRSERGQRVLALAIENSNSASDAAGSRR